MGHRASPWACVRSETTGHKYVLPPSSRSGIFYKPPHPNQFIVSLLSFYLALTEALSFGPDTELRALHASPTLSGKVPPLYSLQSRLGTGSGAVGARADPAPAVHRRRAHDNEPPRLAHASSTLQLTTPLPRGTYCSLNPRAHAGFRPKPAHTQNPTLPSVVSSKTTLVDIFLREHAVIPTPPSRSRGRENNQMGTGFSTALGNLHQGPVSAPG